ncbi:hypothetical protein AAKU67_002230 [Oxalobacteraceae bacterium GrIS 2.11]
MISDAQLKRASFQGVMYYPQIQNPHGPGYVQADELANRPTYIKPGEEPAKAIKRFMGHIKMKAPSRSFPKSFKSTADYFAQYASLNSKAHCLQFTNLSTTGFAIPEGDEVTYEEVEEYCDLI